MYNIHTICGISVHVKVAQCLAICPMSYSQQETPVQTDPGLQLQYTPALSCLPLPWLPISEPLLGDWRTVRKGCNWLYKSAIAEI